jgi:hypothetical protein
MLASVFGMNTSDIRNLSAGQGLFWVTAVPFSVAGLALWLAYLGTLQRYYKSMSSSWKKPKRVVATAKPVEAPKPIMNGDPDRILP